MRYKSLPSSSALSSSFLSHPTSSSERHLKESIFRFRTNQAYFPTLQRIQITGKSNETRLTIYYPDVVNSSFSILFSFDVTRLSSINMSHLQPVPLSMTDNSIDPHRFYEEVKKLSQRLNNDNAHARLRKWGTLDLKVFVGDGTSHPNDVFIQSYLSIIRWAGTFSTVELPQSNRLGIVSRKKIDQIVEWNKKSLRNILYFIEKYPGEKMALVTWVDKQEAGGFATPSMFRLKCKLKPKDNLIF